MSSSPFTSPIVPSQGRKIAPLPLRARARSRSSSTPRTPGSSENVLHINGTPSPSPSFSSEANHSLSPVSGISQPRGNYQSPDAALGARHLSPPAPHIPRIAFQFGQQESNSLPRERQDTYTLRILHNATPRSSLGPEETPLPATQNSFAGLNYSSLPEVATQDHEISQPIHEVYSDEKIAIPDVRNSIERGIPTIAGDYSDTTVTTPHASSYRTPTLLSHTQLSDLSPSRGGLRERSISEVSDVSDIYDNNDSTDPYDVRDEEAPLEPFFTLVFQTALQNGLGIANKVVSAIEKSFGSSELSSDLERLLQDAKRLGTFHSSDTRTIAVLGDSGEGNCCFRQRVTAVVNIHIGKSSLINALLHFPEIAKTVGSQRWLMRLGCLLFEQGDIGSACTSVVTEYRQKTRDHTAPITIEVEYLSESEIEDLIKELLWNYRQIFLPEVEEDKVDAKDYSRYQRESEQAWSALEAGFRHQTGFNKQLLCDMTEGGLAKATGQLIQWAHELEWPDGGNSGTWKATAATADECCEKTSVFMQDRFWPFTKIIR